MDTSTKSGIKLSELTRRIKSVVQNGIGDEKIWIVAEVLSINGSTAGHYYLKLVEYQEGEKIAQCEARIWHPSGAIIVSRFRQSTGIDLASGVQILCRVRVQFHEIHSMSLSIEEIDTTYTIGKMALQKANDIRKLKQEGYLDANKSYVLPVVIQTVAVIASTTSAGLDDFVNTIETNQYGFVLKYCLYQATMQGESAVRKISQQFEKIQQSGNKYDAVVLIRGGGGKDDLSCFDSYELGKSIGLCKYPVLTGIGHSRDMSITDMAACLTLRTPTDVADKILSLVGEVKNRMRRAQNGIEKMVETLLLNEQKKIVIRSHEFNDAINEEVADRSKHLSHLGSGLWLKATTAIDKEYSKKALIIVAIVKLPVRFVDDQHRRLTMCSASLQRSVMHRIDYRAEKNNVLIDRMEMALSHVLASEGSIRLRVRDACMNGSERIIQKRDSIHRAHERVIKAKDPATILKQGFSLTYHSRKVALSTSQLNVGDEIVTRIYRGTIKSTITKLENSDGNREHQ